MIDRIRFSYFRSFFAAVVLLLALNVQMGHAQVNLNANNLSNIRASEISDTQLKEFVRRTQNQGVSIEQAIQLAITRGLPLSEAQQIRTRISGLQDEIAITQALDFQRFDQKSDIDSSGFDAAEVDSVNHLSVFGSSLFQNRHVNFSPSLNIATPKNYQLGPGDELLITVWGDRTDQLQLVVSPEGAVNLQNRGPVFVNGLTIEEAQNRLIYQLSQLYSGLNPSNGQPTTFVQISLGRVRTINVTVTGEVTSPGSYAISSLSTIFNALYAAGGPNEIGSYRRIRVIRENRIISELDLYDFLLHGDQSDNIRLRDQDVVQVQPYSNHVKITGEILRPAIYELNGMNSFQDLVLMSGGFKRGAYSKQIRIHRFTDSQRRIVTVPESLYEDFILVNGDSIYVEKVLDRYENKVTITGAVWRPGEYELKDNMTLNQLIADADGLRPDAFQSRGLINRIRPDLSNEQISFNVEQVVLEPYSYDIPLQREDEVIIRGVTDLRDEAIVEIGGSVREAGVYVWFENMTVQDLILKANGTRDSAELSRIDISRRTRNFNETGRLVETITLGIDKDLTLDSEQLSITLQPYDVVFVHRRPDFQIQQFVTVEGEVRYPGRYAIKSQNERLSDIIERAGGVTGEAYVPGARINRHKRVIDRARVDYTFLGVSEQFETDTKADTITRIGIDLVAALRNHNSQENLIVMEGDVIRIPKIAQTVRVTGGVMQEVEIRYVPGASYNYYINRAGGLSTRALKKRGYVVYANGDVDRNRRLFWITFKHPVIEPGAEIVVPIKAESNKMSTQEIISISSVIVSMTTTVLLAIDRLSR